jgi:SET domain-containing protein
MKILDDQNVQSNFKDELDSIIAGIQSWKNDGIDQLKDLLKRYPDSTEIMGQLAWALGHLIKKSDSPNCESKFPRVIFDIISTVHF